MFRRRRPERPAPTWDRPKMLGLLIGGCFVAVLLVVGLVLAVIYAVTPPQRRNASSPPTTPIAIGGAPSAGDPHAIQAARDELANRPMASASAELAKPGPMSTRDPGMLRIPKPTALGPAGVPAGFPQTSEGALAQLAAIDQVALQTGNLAGARAVIKEWVAPGGPTPESWSGTALLAMLLESTGLSGGGSPEFALVVTPLMGLIKGTVGTDFVVPCIDFEFQVTLTSTARAAIADCQRMVWIGGRWVIGPGPEPAPAPSIWPGTDAAIDAGYKDLRHV